MAKEGFTSLTVGPVLQQRSDHRGWSLCIGAGTSYPLFPSWHDLVRRLIAKDIPAPEANTVADEMLRRFSPDALLEAASDRLGLTSNKFTNLLATELMADVRSRLTSTEWRIFARALSSHHIGSLTRPMWDAFIRLRNSHLMGLSATQLAPVIVRTIGTPVQPASILSFNAEAIFLAMLNAEVVEQNWPTNTRTPPTNVFEVVTRSVSTRHQDRIPYYFCHGLLPLSAKDRHRGSVEKLVFSEGDYLQLANNAFSWQSTAFLGEAMGRSLVFIGVSLSDPNMRRWLSWTHTNRIREIAEYKPNHGSSTIHYWIVREPKNTATKRWVESTVAHLGVRVVWIKAWDDTADTLSCMLGQ